MINFDQGGGSFNATEGDLIQVNGFTTDPAVSYVNGNTVLDLNDAGSNANGLDDVLTLQGVTQSDFEALGGLNGSEFINGGGNNPTINGAGNTVNYTGTPVTLDQSLTISDSATITSLTATISTGAQTGDTLIINGMQTGTLTNTNDGSSISYNFDSNTDVMTLSVASGTPTIGDFVGAEQDIQYSTSNSNPTVSGTDLARTVTWEVTDSNNDSSSPVITTVDIVSPAPTVSWGTGTVSGTEGQRIALQTISATANGGGTLKSLVISGIPVDDTLNDGHGHSFTAAAGSTSINVINWTLSNLGITSPTDATFTLMATATEQQNSEPVQTSAATESVIVGPPVAPENTYLWASDTVPATSGTHDYGPFASTNGSVVAEIYGDTTSGYSDNGPDVITTNLATFDPFLLPYQSGSQQVGTTTITDFPLNRQQLILPSLSPTQTKGLGFYLTEDGSGTATINEFTFTVGATGLNGPLTVVDSGPVESGLIGGDLQFLAAFTNGTSINNGATTLNSTFTGTGASYGLAWAQLNTGTDTYTGDFQIFNPDGSTASSVVQLFSVANVGGPTAAPAWYFRNAGLNSSGNVIYGAAIAELNAGTNSDYIQFQAYTVAGAAIADPGFTGSGSGGGTGRR